MKNIKFLVMVGMICVGMTSCSLWPKSVEFGQRSVPKLPAKSPTQIEYEKQAADLVDKKIEQAYIAALQEQSTSNVINPLEHAHVVAPALSISLGEPKSQYTGNATNLSSYLSKENAKLDAKVEVYRAKIEPLVGKKIEGTGFFQMSYISYILMLIVIFFIIKFIIKIVGAFYPPVSIASNLASSVVRPSVQVVAKSLGQVVRGGEDFLGKVKTEFEGPVSDKIIAMFKDNHQKAQDQEVQRVIGDLTKNT